MLKIGVWKNRDDAKRRLFEPSLLRKQTQFLWQGFERKLGKNIETKPTSVIRPFRFTNLALYYLLRFKSMELHYLSVDGQGCC